MIVSALILLQSKRKNGFYRSNDQHKQTSTYSPVDNTAKFGPHCRKDSVNQTYKVCTELPFSDIKCGEKYSQKKEDPEGKFLVPDVVFFVWFGDSLKFHFFNYLALRSAAAIHQPERIDFYYSISLPVGKSFDRQSNTAKSKYVTFVL